MRLLQVPSTLGTRISRKCIDTIACRTVCISATNNFATASSLSGFKEIFGLLGIKSLCFPRFATPWSVYKIRLILSYEIRLYLRVNIYTFTFSDCQSLAILLPYGIVVGRFPVRDFEADYPILIILKHSHLSLFHLYAVVYETLRAFQPLNKIFNICHHIKSHLIYDIILLKFLYVWATRKQHPFSIAYN